jgi:RNA polymerase sigma-70 factor (ECF subfamily)
LCIAICAQENATNQKKLQSYSTESKLKSHADIPEANRADLDLADVERVLAGEVRAFEGIVRRWQGPLINLAWRYCRDRARAEELAQEAFLRAWKHLAHWRREAAFSTWLFALAANVYRSDLKHFPTIDLPLEAAPEPTRSATQFHGLALRQSEERIRTAVVALPMRYREPVLLFYFHEMDLSQTAATLKMPEGTIKARLSRARALLRKRFPQLAREQALLESEAAEIDPTSEAAR